MTLRRQIRDRFPGSLWALAWMWPLIAPAISIAQDRVHPQLPAAVGLGAFVLLYLVVVTNGFDDQRPVPSRVDVALLFALAAIGITLLNVYGDRPSGWLNVMLYVAVAGPALLNGVWTSAMWVLCACGVFTGYVFNTDVAGSDAAQVIFGMLLAGMLVHVMKQMLRYIRMLKSTRAELARTAVTEERLRFARDLHDLLGHTMSVIVVKAEVVRRLVEREPAVAARAAADIEEIGRTALAQVRQAVDGYRAPEFAVELDGVRAALGDAGIAVRVTQAGPPLPEVARRVFGWVIREATTNVIRHSGASHCDITVTVDTTAARVEVSDDGTGSGRRTVTGERIGVGLIGLTERVVEVSGTLVSGDRPGGGFGLVATIPVGSA